MASQTDIIVGQFLIDDLIYYNDPNIKIVVFCKSSSLFEVLHLFTFYQ